jgi:16S rRNA (guanine(966)-N(2))-methyltransferase RsmD
MAKRIKNKPLKRWKSPAPEAKEGCLRIIGGKLRGRQLDYSGDPRTRPMKDNVREALFNLVGAYVKGKHVIDLFAGTGAIGLEAISRGATRATMIERHIPTARLIRRNAESLGVEAQTEVVSSDTFFWFRQFAKSTPPPSDLPWIVFCSPPYDFFLERTKEMIELISGAIDLAPSGSIIVCESDSRFRLRSLPNYENWRTKHYSPAVVSVYHTQEDQPEANEAEGNEAETNEPLTNETETNAIEAATLDEDPASG